MSYPGSRIIEKIDFTQLKFLVNNTVVDSITDANFDLTTGKPLNNLSNNANINTFFVNTVSSSLYENTNINNNFIYKYPKVLELDVLRDMQVTEETTIDAVFIFEGASMKNMFGYYMYTVDENGNKKLLANDTETGGYYYSPTVIFPHVYSDASNSNTLQKGNKRRLIGNMPNGNFSNIYIGLFLIPHGWYASVNSSPIDNNAILYSTIDFNASYINSEFQSVNDKIYSVYFKSTSDQGHELLMIAFEDIIVSGTYDLDYNDCVVGFEISDVANIVDYDKYTSVEVDEEEDVVLNNIIFIDDNGEYVKFDKNIYHIDTTKNHIFERHMIFNNQSDRDSMYTIYNASNTNYKLSVTKVNEDGLYKLVLKHLFRMNDLKNVLTTNNGNSNGNGLKNELYLYESKFNKNNTSTFDAYRSLISKILEDSTYSEKYRLYRQDNNSEVIHLTDTINKPTKEFSNKFRIIGNGVMDCKSGKSHLPFDTKQIYKVYKNVRSGTNIGIDINVKMDDHPTNYMLNHKTFLRYVSFRVSASELVIIDLANLNIYQEVDGNLVLNNSATFSNINVSSITYTNGNIKDIISIFKSDSGAFYRTVTLNGSAKFYCIRLPNVKNNPTMVLMNDGSYLEWNDKFNTLSGTYFNKNVKYAVSNFSA